MKGLILPTVIAGMAFTLFVLVFVLIPLVALRVNLISTINYENDYNNAELGLLTFLSATHEGKPVSQIIAGHISTNDPQNLEMLKPKLDKLFQCYELKNENKVLLKSGCRPAGADASLEIALPANAYKTKLTLVVE